VLVFGVYATVDGVFAIFSAIQGETRDRAIHLFEGILGIAVGTLVFLFPDQAGTALVLVIGLGASASGVVAIISAVRLRREIDDEWLLGLSGVHYPRSHSDLAPEVLSGHDNVRTWHLRTDLRHSPRRTWSAAAAIELRVCRRWLIPS
jgi:hypothetical protein